MWIAWTRDCDDAPRDWRELCTGKTWRDAMQLARYTLHGKTGYSLVVLYHGWLPPAGPLGDVDWSPEKGDWAPDPWLSG